MQQDSLQHWSRISSVGFSIWHITVGCHLHGNALVGFGYSILVTIRPTCFLIGTGGISFCRLRFIHTWILIRLLTTWTSGEHTAERTHFQVQRFGRHGVRSPIECWVSTVNYEVIIATLEWHRRRHSQVTTSWRFPHSANHEMVETLSLKVETAALAVDGDPFNRRLLLFDATDRHGSLPFAIESSIISEGKRIACKES